MSLMAWLVLMILIRCIGTGSHACIDSVCACATTAFRNNANDECVTRKKPDETCAANQCVEHATCDAVSSPTKCECDTGYTATPIASPTICSGVVNLASLSYMYVVPILVSMMSLLR